MVRGNLTLAAGAAVALLGGCATAPVVVDPTWADVPSADDMGDAYPAFAVQTDTPGFAILRCRGDLEGRLANCRVIKADPAGFGFESAALSLTPRFRMSPRQVDGDISKSSVQFQVTFRPAPEEPLTPWTGPEPEVERLAVARIVASRNIERQGPPADRLTEAELDLPADRSADALRLIRQVDAEMEAEAIEAMALGMARLLTLEQLRALEAQRRPPGEAPSPEAMKAASPEFEALSRQRGERVRALYCARYAC